MVDIGDLIVNILLYTFHYHRVCSSTPNLLLLVLLCLIVDSIYGLFFGIFDRSLEYFPVIRTLKNLLCVDSVLLIAGVAL